MSSLSTSKLNRFLSRSMVETVHSGTAQLFNRVLAPFERKQKSTSIPVPQQHGWMSSHIL